MILSLAGPLAVTPMEAARYTISGVPNFPERKNHLKEFGYGMLDKAGDAIIQDEDIGAKAQAQMVRDYFALRKLDKELKDNFDPLMPLSLNMGGRIPVYAEDGYMGYRFPVPKDMNMPSDERKMQAKIIGDKIKERRKNIYEYLIDINPFGSAAFQRLQDKAMENKYLDEKTGVYIPYYDAPFPSYYNMGGYAEEKPMVSLAGEYATTTPMPAPNYSNIDAPQIQRGSGGNMAKDMAMKMGMKMAMTAMGIPPVFNEGGYVPQYANEGMMPVGYKEDFPGIAGFSLLRPFVKGMDKLFGYDRYPNESGNVPMYEIPEVEVIPLPNPESEMKGPPPDMPYYDPPRDFYDNPPRAPLTDPSELEQNQKRIEDIDRQIEEIEKRIEELKRKEAIENENMFKKSIEEGQIPGAGYASLPMDKKNITRLMS